MTTLIAKPIIQNQFWIVTDGNKKVGNIEANSAGYSVQVNGNLFQFTNTEDISKSTHIRFQTIKIENTKPTQPYPEYPTTKTTHNSVFDIQRGLHLFTKSKKSKCFYAAGWFVINHSDIREIVFCPKYIFLQRYNYKGPFINEDEAKNMINI